VRLAGSKTWRPRLAAGSSAKDARVWLKADSTSIATQAFANACQLLI